MALVQCPECKREVSSKASTCPHCGHPIGGAEGSTPAKKRVGYGMGCLVLIGLFIVVSVYTESKRATTGTSGSSGTSVGTDPERDLEVTNHKWTINEYGRATHTIKIKNNGTRTYKDLVVNIHYHAKTGASLGYETVTFYEFFPVGKTITVITEHVAPTNSYQTAVSIITAQ